MGTGASEAKDGSSRDAPSICVYAGSSLGSHPRYRDAAVDLGTTLARQGCTLVFGGGSRGLMGVVADAALTAGGEVIGVIPEAMVEVEVAHPRVPKLNVVSSMHERKKLMADLSDAFIALPGGVGTVEELVEVWTWTHLGFHDKPCGLLDVDGYYRPLVQFFDHATAEGFLAERSRELLIVSDDAAELIGELLTAGSPEHQRLLARHDL